MSSQAPLRGEKFHLIGVGGAGMSVIAELLASKGGEVSGSDRLETPVVTGLVDKGIDAYCPHDATRLPSDATVVVSSAIRETNPELMLARERGQQIIHRSEALALVAQGQSFVAVAGAHGKTTTSAMIAVALLSAGADASFAIGGPVLGEGTGARMGEGVFVAEADESDGSFLHYSPEVAVITNVEPDHLDHFGTHAEFMRVFEQFVERIVPAGTLVCCEEDLGSASLADFARRNREDLQVITYGRPDKSEHPPTISITEVELGSSSASALFTCVGSTCPVELRVTGEHNVLNAAGAWAACVAVGIGESEAAWALRDFCGAGRRFEKRGEVAGRRVFVDYAHHPTEVQAALKQGRLVAGEGRLVAVFQPHLYSRTRNFADRFAEALSQADEVVLTDIYAAREDPIPEVTSRLVSDSPFLTAPHYFVEDAQEAAALAASLTGAGDICLLVGAGDIFEQSSTVIQTWKDCADGEAE